MKYKNIKLKTKLLITALLISFIPLLIIGGFALLESRDALSNQAFEHLESVRESKKSQLKAFFAERESDMHVLLDIIASFKHNATQKMQKIQRNKQSQLQVYFQERLNNLRVLAKNTTITLAVKQINQAYKQRTESNAWQDIETHLNSELTQYHKTYGLDDLLLIAPDGYIFYSIAKRYDLRQNVLSGVLKKTHLHQAFQKGLQGIAVQDFAPYPPANNQYVAFLTAPIIHANELIGVYAFSLSPNAINEIVQERENMGTETYLVGKLNGQTSYRSSRIVAGKEAQLGDKKTGEDINKALDGQIGVEVKTGSTGNLEITAYAPLQILDFNWAIVTTIGLEEILVSQLMDEQEDFFAKYIHHYGYYDLFLIHPQGKIFYSVEHESDYLTNILTGKYANSSLGQLVKKVLQTQNFAMSDFAPYSPSNDEPAAFIAQPLTHDSHIELIVALQFSDKATNTIMQQRSGMGNTGETYLVGSDKLMRSNSYLDPIHHSIIASFANPIAGTVDTQATRSALAGETGKGIIQDYRGSQVLSAYTPITVGDTIWALIAEIDKAEAYAVINKLELWLIVIILIIAIIMVIFITHATKLLITPLLKVNEHLKTLALGKVINEDIEYRNNDEIGELVTSSRTLREGMKISIAQANAIASGNYNQKVELLSEQDQLGHSLTEMTNILRDTTEKNAREDWLKTGQAQLNELMSGEQDIKRLAKKVIAFLTTYVEASVGLFYLLQESESENYLQLIASYAYTANDDIPDKFAFGEGLVGQVALEKQTILRLHEPDESTKIIQSGLAQATPKYVIILPFLYEGNVKGVIEVGASKTLTEIQGEFLDQIMSNIGIAVNTAISRTKMQHLLEQSQRQAEALQHKQAELQQTNEELQSQSEELQSQSEELQSQQEELRQTNETLEERTKGLERQRSEVQAKNLALEQTKIEMEKAQTAIEVKAKELELASKYKSEFLANMSHELRTPLNSLLILAQLLAENKQGNLTEEQVKYAETVHSAGNDLLLLINDILDLSKVEAGKIEVQWENVILHDLLNMVEQKFRHVAEDNGLAFNLTIGDNVPTTLSTDSQRLKQIINNLLSNAFKFTSDGEVKVMAQRPTRLPHFSALTNNTLEVNKTITISVIDSGIGIPEDKQQIIFEAFQQADGTTSRSYGGTGLGLSISRQLARLLGGELTLTSEKNKGSTFTLYLPVANSDSQSSPPSQDTASLQTFATITPKLAAPKQDIFTPEPIADDRDKLKSGDKSLLIIEDDQKFSTILLDLARNKGFKCIIAEDGVNGLQLAEKYKPNAIILDVGLPRLDGWMVMERLKDNPDTRHIPVHFMSAADHQDIDARKMGAIGYLAKPVNMEQLGDAFKKIERFLTTTMKYLLVITDIKPHQQKIVELIGEENIKFQLATSITATIQQLKETIYDCIILDMDIENGSGTELLEQMQQVEGFCQTPLIAYTERDLTTNEEALLLRCADELPLKSVKSPERLLDETILFLHQLEANLPEEKRNMLQMVHDKAAILKHKKVLIVDDDVRNTYALAIVLENHDMEVITTPDGKQGLAKLEENDDVAIVLMDIMMPEMDGFETIKQIRQQLRFRQLPIIALTAKAMKGDKTKCIEAGANDYLAKPVETNKLLSLMRVWLYR